MKGENNLFHVPEERWQLPRRTLLERLLAVSSAGLLFGKSASAYPPLSLPGAEETPEQFWRLIKSQFPLRRNLILLNAANLCPAPDCVLGSLFGLSRDIDSDPSFQNREKFAELREEARVALAEYLGSQPQEIVLLRNTTEGNNLIVQGLDLEPGDEVILWDQNHPSNNVAWDVQAQRHGFRVKRVSCRTPPHDHDELLSPFIEAFSGKTRILAVSHISNISGVALPIEDLCRIARQRGILTLVDGAQSFGALQVDLHRMGCDFYTGSAHKWLVGPKEAGVLYVRQESIDHIWPAVVGAGWTTDPLHPVQKFERLGQRNDATLAALTQAVQFHRHIGKERVERRIRQLCGILKDEIGKLPGVTVYTPASQAWSAGVLVFSLPRVDPVQAFASLYNEHLIAGAGGQGMFPGIRFCPHIYNTLEDIDKVVSAVTRLARKQPA